MAGPRPPTLAYQTCVHVFETERKRAMKGKDSKRARENVMSYFVSLSVIELSFQTYAIVLKQAALWSDEVWILNVVKIIDVK